MNKIIIITIIIFFVFSIFCSEKNTKEEMVKRTIMIVPFLNNNNVEKYSYISDALRDALKAKLLDTDQFNLINFDLIETKSIEMGFDKNSIIEEKNSKDLALKLKADVFIIGKYIIIEDKIMIQIDAYDIFTGDTVASTNVKGELGLDIFRIIDDSVMDMSDKLKTKLKEVKKSYFTEMTELLKKERRLKFKENFSIPNKVGIGLTVSGSTLFAAGLGIFIFDLAYYYNIVKDNLYYNPRTDTGYSDYVNTYYTYISLLSAGITSFCIGGVLVGVGIPLIIYKKKNKALTFNLHMDSSIKFEICLKL